MRYHLSDKKEIIKNGSVVQSYQMTYMKKDKKNIAMNW